MRAQQACVAAAFRPLSVWKVVARLAYTAWGALREWSGDAAYERYLHRSTTLSPTARALSPAEFYLEHLSRKYSRPSHCC